MTTPMSGITMARLKAWPPHLIYEELREFAAAEQHRAFASGNPELERMLLGRGEHLIDLGLAEFAGSQEVVGELYARGRSGSTDPDLARGLRLACLSNQVASLASWSGSVSGVSTDELARLANEGEDDEISALFGNRSYGGVLARLYLRKAPFDTVPIERLVRLVGASIGNARLIEDRSRESGPDLTAWDIHKGILELVLNASVTETWARVLHRLLLTIDPSQTRSPSAEQANAAIERWKTLKILDTFSKEESEESAFYTEQPLVTELRCLIAALYGRFIDGKAFKTVGSTDSDDVARRCAFYANAPVKELTTAAIHAAYERDADVFLFAMLFNNGALLDRGRRQLLERRMSRPLHYLYASRCKQLKSHWPNADLEPLTDAAADAASDTPESEAPSPELSALRVVESGLSTMKAKLDAVSSRVGWTLAIVSAAVAYEVWRRL